MKNYIILNKRKNLKKVLKIINNLNLKKSFKNKRTTIWENDNLKVSIDNSIIRVLIYSKDDILVYTDLFIKG